MQGVHVKCPLFGPELNLNSECDDRFQRHFPIEIHEVVLINSSVLFRRTDRRETNGKVPAMYLFRLRLKALRHQQYLPFLHYSNWIV
jgi:hypothetical protein